MVVLVAKECNIRVNASNEETRFIFGGSGVMVSAWWTICKKKTAEVPQLLRASKYTGNFLTKIIPNRIKIRHFAPQARRIHLFFALSPQVLSVRKRLAPVSTYIDASLQAMCG